MTGPHEATSPTDRRLQFRAALPLVGAVAIFGLALFAIHHVLAEFDMTEVTAHLRNLDAWSLWAALGFSVLAYAMLALYDLSAMAYIGARPPYRTVALGSFVGYALSNNVGFMVLSGGAVRYRIYSAAGLSNADIARVVLFCTSTFSVGVMAVGGGALLVSPEVVTPLLRLPAVTVQALAGAGLAALLVALAVASVRREPLRLWRWRLDVPTPKLLAIQIVVSSIEIAASAGILWVLLPDPGAIGFAPFMAIYAGALVISVLSHVPGGLGVFESVILVGLAGTVPAGGVLGALVAYRVFYFILPLLVATVMLAAYELLARRHAAARAARWFGGWAPRVVPTLVGSLVFAGGVALLVSGATLPVREQLDDFAHMLPPWMLEAAHFLTSLIGLALLFLARGLFRRMTAAYLLTMALLGVGIGLTMAKEAAWAETGLLALVALLLAPFRREFNRRTPLRSLRLTPGWLAAVAGAVIGAGWLAVFIAEHTEYGRVTWWRFAMDERVPLSLRALLGLAVAATVFGLWRLTRPAPYRPHPPTADEFARAAAIAARADRADAAVALVGDKALLFSRSGQSFLMYGVSGNGWVAFGDPVGPAEERSELIWRFRDLCDRRGGRFAFFAIAGDTAPDYEEAGLALTQIGTAPRLRLADVEPASLEALRHAAERAERGGLRVELHLGGFADGESLTALSAAWLATRGESERGFAFGRFDPAYLARVPVAIVRRSGRPVAFATLWRGRDELAFDLMRQDPAAPSVALDLLLWRVLDWARSAGVATLDLGLAPPVEPLKMRSDRLGHFATRYANHLYRFRRLWRLRAEPVHAPRYLASPAGQPPSRALADAAALIGGGTAPHAAHLLRPAAE